MNDLLCVISIALLAIAILALWQRHGWRVRHFVRRTWRVRCAQCGGWFRWLDTQPAQRTTGHYVNLCDACWIDTFTPRAK